MKTLYSWEYGNKCNDCDKTEGIYYEVKYPRMKRGTIKVCLDCLNKYYKKKEYE
jgi:hypothetical protein